MTKFKGFAEASKLYASNAKIVDLMYEAMLDDIGEFLRAVTVELGPLVAPHQLQTTETSKDYWYVWLGPDGQHKDNYPQLWLQKTDAVIIVPGSMKMVAIAPGAPKDSLKTLADVARHPKCVAFCKTHTGGPWSLFNVEIDVNSGDEAAVERSAMVIANVLLAFQDAYASMSAASGDTT